MRHSAIVSRSVNTTRLIIVAVLIIVVSAPLLGQSYSQEMDVTVIQVPVVVSRGGKPVTGLTKGDFTVFVNGEQHPIAYFDVLSFATLAPDVIAAQPAATKSAPPDLVQRRMTLLLFDIANSSYGAMRRSRAEAQAFIASAPRNELFAVATYSGRGVRYVVPFTTDRVAAARAVATFSASEARDTLALAISPAERAAMSAPLLLPEASAGAEQAFSDESAAAAMVSKRAFRMPAGASLIEAMERETAIYSGSEAEKWAAALIAVADRVKPLEGLKQVVLFSEGSGIESEQLGSFDQVARRLHKHFRAAGVVLNVVDAGGLRGPNPAGGPMVGRPPSGPQQTKLARFDSSATPEILYTAALDTGGQVIGNTGVASALRRLQESRSVTYLIGIRPPDEQRRDNMIEVKVKGQPRFTEIYYRRGFDSATTAAAVNGLMLADVMMNDIRRNDVSVKLDVAAAGALEANIAIPSAELAAHAVEGSINVDLFVYVFDAKGSIAGWTYRRLAFDAEKMRAELGTAPYLWRERFHLAPGAYAVKALVHVLGRDRVGFDRVDVLMPAAAE